MNLDEETYRELGLGDDIWGRALFRLFVKRSYSAPKPQGARIEPIRQRERFTACRGCNRRFDRRPRGWLRSFCTDVCRVKFHNKREKAERPAACEFCKKVIKQNLGGRVRHFCDDSCAKKHQRAAKKS